MKKYLVSKFTKTNSMERGQALVRLVFALSAIVWLTIISLKNSTECLPVVLSIGAYLLFALGIVIHMAMHPDSWAPRVSIMVITDPLMVYFCFYLVGDYAAPMLFIFFTSPIGNGFRFGMSFLLASAMASGLALLMSLLLRLNYHQDALLIVGFMLAFIIVNVGVGIVVRKLAQVKENLAKLALHDSLTDLPNRELFKEKVDKMIRLSQRSKTEVACFFIDLDGFKTVNDQCGHAIGDKLIIRISSVLRQCVRACDVAARLSGDEFAVATSCSKNKEVVLHLAARILKEIEAVTEVLGHPIAISASIGIAYCDHTVSDGDDMDANLLLQRADLAMYAAKNSGKGKIKVANAFNA